ncbi:MAG: hypothetical protein KKB35_12415, partial [Proteobacteria bacterium]|nr:hypothetical protein [Pseudomonadota bacterium]
FQSSIVNNQSKIDNPNASPISSLSFQPSCNPPALLSRDPLGVQLGSNTSTGCRVIYVLMTVPRDPPSGRRA